MRWEVVERFNHHVSPFLKEIKSIAVVGGGINEPELDVFRNSKDLVVHFFGIESNIETQNFTYLNLNTNFENDTQQFDLVICSQVLEHIWDVKQGLENLIKLAKPSGLIWIGCPSSNYAHGSPDYFSAGYQPSLITNLMQHRGLQELVSGTLGSERYYFMTHGIQIWASRDEHKSPLTHGLSRYFLGQFMKRLSAYFKSPKILENSKFSTETFWLGRKY
jgi:SAM-dependent methyltransferase